MEFRISATPAARRPYPQLLPPAPLNLAPGRKGAHSPFWSKYPLQHCQKDLRHLLLPLSPLAGIALAPRRPLTAASFFPTPTHLQGQQHLRRPSHQLLPAPHPAASAPTCRCRASFRSKYSLQHHQQNLCRQLLSPPPLARDRSDATARSPQRSCFPAPTHLQCQQHFRRPCHQLLSAPLAQPRAGRKRAHFLLPSFFLVQIPSATLPAEPSPPNLAARSPVPPTHPRHRLIAVGHVPPPVLRSAASQPPRSPPHRPLWTEPAQSGIPRT